MQDWIIIGSFGLALIFLIVGRLTTNSVGGLFAGAVLFILIGVGLLGTGWQTYDNAPIQIDSSENPTVVTFTILTYPATLEANPTLYFFGVACVIMALALILMSLREQRTNAIAKQVQIQFE